jgi:hypothetical protein
MSFVAFPKTNASLPTASVPAEQPTPPAKLQQPPQKKPRPLDCQNPFDKKSTPCQAMPPLWRDSKSLRPLDTQNPWNDKKNPPPVPRQPVPRTVQPLDQANPFKG